MIMLVFLLSLSLVSMLSMGTLSLSCFNYFFLMGFLDPLVFCEDLDRDARSLACESY